MCKTPLDGLSNLWPKTRRKLMQRTVNRRDFVKAAGAAAAAAAAVKIIGGPTR